MGTVQEGHALLQEIFIISTFCVACSDIIA